MITVQEAHQVIMENARDFGTIKVPLLQSNGKILRETFYADRAFPPFDRVTMDGIAIHYEAYANGQRDFPMEGIVAAGTALQKLSSPQACLEVMTGAVLPMGCDTVIRYEDLQIQDGRAHIELSDLARGKNVHIKGSDRKDSAPLVLKGKVLGPAELGIAATIGKSNVLVSKGPKTIIISTGDELVPVDKKPLAHQIRRSNVFSIQAMLAKLGCSADLLHLEDDLQIVIQKMREVLAKYELVILSGGVSKGKFDYLPEAMERLEVEKLFYKIKQRPGKPFWFGKSPAGALVFALPGNPVSSFLCTQRYVVPFLEKCLQIETPAPAYAMLMEDFNFAPALSYFLQVKSNSSSEGIQEAYPVTGKGSGDLANLCEADGFLELPAELSFFPKGSIYPFFTFR